MISPAVFARALELSKRGTTAPSLCALLAAGADVNFAPPVERVAQRDGNSGRHFSRARRPT